jgi:hypothetical protein
MFLSRRRIILVVAIAAITIAIILLPLILATVSAPDINSITIELSKVEVADIANDKTIPLNLFFNIHNPTDKAKIDYNLIADGKPLGQGFLSYEDIPLNGRPQLSPGLTTTLKSTFELNQSNLNSDIFRVIKNAQATEQINWKVEGVAQIESAFSFSPKQFSDELNE